MSRLELLHIVILEFEIFNLFISFYFMGFTGIFVDGGVVAVSLELRCFIWN
jgi:hypothetical protein